MRLYEQVLHFLPDEHKVGTLVGLYRSAFRGKGLEYEDLRQYMPGDEPRNFAWSRYAQTRQLYSKTYREERDLTVYIIVDPSLVFIEWWPFKYKKVSETISLLALSSTCNRDKLGAAFININGSSELLPASRGNGPIAHASAIHEKVICAITPTRGGQKRSLSCLLEPLVASLKQSQAMVFVLSDFLSLQEEDYDLLQRVKRKSDLIAIRVLDRWDIDPLPLGESLLRGPSSECLFDPLLHPFDMNEAIQLQSAIEREITRAEKSFRAWGIDLVEIREEAKGYSEVPFIALKEFFCQRAHRRTKGGDLV